MSSISKGAYTDFVLFLTKKTQTDYFCFSDYSPNRRDMDYINFDSYTVKLKQN